MSRQRRRCNLHAIEIQIQARNWVWLLGAFQLMHSLERILHKFVLRWHLQWHI